MTAARRWTALAVLTLPVLLISIDMSVLGIAVPALSADLKPSSAQLLWIIDLYSFLLAGLLIVMGALGDRIGRKRILLIGAPVFGVASLMAAFSTSAEMLIAARALLGIGGATLMPSTLGLLRSIFHDRVERRTAIAVWAAAFSGGTALGPTVGGFLLEHFQWGSVFLLNVPIIAIFLAIAPWLLPESKDPEPGPFDPLSAVLSIAGLISVVYALKTGVKGFTWVVALALVTGLIILTAFIRRQLRTAHPMLDMNLFRTPAFSSAVSINVISMFTLMGVMFFFPQYLMLVEGLGAAEAGLWLVPLSAAAVVGTFLAPLLARFAQARTVIMCGLACIIGGFAVAHFLEEATGMFLFVCTSILVGTGAGLAETLTNDVILSAAPLNRAGAAAAISETGYEFGGAMGTAVLGTVGLAAYTATVTERAADIPGMDPGLVQDAGHTLAEAHAIASTLPDGGQALRELANSAFMAGMDLVAVVCIAMVTVAVVVAWRGIPRDEELQHLEHRGSTASQDVVGDARLYPDAGDESPWDTHGVKQGAVSASAGLPDKEDT